MNVRIALALYALIGLAVPSVAASVEVTVLDPAGQPLPEVAVHLAPLSGKAPRGKLTGVIDQVNKEFVPLVSVMQVGTAVSFPNKDNIRHSIYSFSTPKPFELKLYSGTPSAPVVFDKPGVVVLGCNIHDWMIGYVWIVESPWFAKTDRNGNAIISDLPNGDYTLDIWHPYQTVKAAEQKIRVGAGAESHFNFRLKLMPPPNRQQSSANY